METALAEIGERLNQGQPEALEDCYRTLGPLVMSYLARYVPQPDIEDVMQRVFYEVWRVHARYDPDLAQFWKGRVMPANRVMFRIIPTQVRTWGLLPA